MGSQSTTLGGTVSRRASVRFLWRLLPQGVRYRHQEKAVRQYFAGLMAEAKDRGAKDEVQSLRSQMAFELHVLDDTKEAAFTERLLRQAARLRVPVPLGTSQYWRESDADRARVLTREGIQQLRAEIRKEQRWRGERRSQWVVWITALTGLVGALTGMLAVLR